MDRTHLAINQVAFVPNQLDGASSPTERLRIDSAGLVGIGTDNPGNVLHLQKNGGDAILELQNSGNGNHSGIFFVRESSGGVNKGAANIHVESNTSGSGSNFSIWHW